METTNTVETVSPLNEFQIAAIEAAEKDLAALNAKAETEKYLIDIDKAGIEMIKNFIANDASWKFTEALGIIEVEKDFKEAKKTGKLFIKAVAIEAIYYYLSKVEGNGKSTNCSSIKQVEDYLKILKAITEGVERVKADAEKIRQAEYVVAARREGINIDAETETVA